MKNIKNLVPVIALSTFLLIVISGCVSGTPNPQYITQNPQTGQLVTNNAVAQTVYGVSPSLGTISNAVTQAAAVAAGIAASIPQTAPIAPAINPIVTYGLGLAFAVSSLIAGYKNNQANKHSAAAAALAATVNQSGQNANAMNIAAGNGSQAAVAVHLANAASLT